MISVGLTGGIGSGKSTVSEVLRENGITIIDADIVSREVLETCPSVVKDIKSTFGEHFFDNNEKLIRKKLGDYIFRYPEERKKLDNIMIPLIKREICRLIEKYDKEGIKICIVDAPTLIEHNLHKDMNLNILVWVDKTTQMSRIMIRDNLTHEQVINRMNAQMPLDDKKNYVDFIIDNSSKLSSTKEQVEDVIKILKEYSQ